MIGQSTRRPSTSAELIADRCVDKIIATAGVYDRSLRIDIIARIVRSLMVEDLPRETSAAIAADFFSVHLKDRTMKSATEMLRSLRRDLAETVCWRFLEEMEAPTKT
jgi:hypothetical protein